MTSTRSARVRTCLGLQSIVTALRGSGATEATVTIVCNLLPSGSDIPEVAPRVVRIQSGQFAQDVLGALVCNSRYHHLHFHKLVAAHIAAQGRGPLAAQSQPLSALSSRRNLDGARTIDGRHLNLGSQRC